MRPPPTALHRSALDLPGAGEGDVGPGRGRGRSPGAGQGQATKDQPDGTDQQPAEGEHPGLAGSVLGVALGGRGGRDGPFTRVASRSSRWASWPVVGSLTAGRAVLAGSLTSPNVSGPLGTTRLIFWAPSFPSRVKV